MKSYYLKMSKKILFKGVTYSKDKVYELSDEIIISGLLVRGGKDIGLLVENGKEKVDYPLGLEKKEVKEEKEVVEEIREEKEVKIFSKKKKKVSKKKKIVKED